MKATVLTKNYIKLETGVVAYSTELKKFKTGDLLEVNHTRDEEDHDKIEIIGLYEIEEEISDISDPITD